MKNSIVTLAVYIAAIFAAACAVYLDSYFMAIAAVYFGFISGCQRCGGVPTRD